MNKKIPKRFLVFILFCLSPFFVLAIESPSFLIKPAKQEIILKPGQTIQKTIIVTNHLGYKAVFSLSVDDLNWPGKDKLINKFSLKNYLAIKESDITIADGQSGSITYKVVVPKEAIPGGGYGYVGVLAKAVDGEARVSTTLASVVFLRIDGVIKESGELLNFGVVGDNIKFSSGKTKLHLSYENSGQIYLNPYGKIKLNKNLTQTKVLDISPWSILPGETKLREFSIDTRWPGYYTATIYLNRGYKNFVDTQTTSFWILPWWLLFIILLIIVVIIWRIVLKFKKRNAQAI